MVEFCPTADGDGWYRKYAAAIVGDRIVPRHMMTGRDWMLKVESARSSAEIIAKELQYHEENPHRQQIAEIAALYIDRRTVREALSERCPAPHSQSRLARLLMPARPVLEPLLRPAFPWVGRIARRLST